jgi:hypothetical protein
LDLLLLPIAHSSSSELGQGRTKSGLIEELGENSDQNPKEERPGDFTKLSLNGREESGGLEVLCIPVRDEADEIAGVLVARARAARTFGTQHSDLYDRGDIVGSVAQFVGNLPR